MTSSRSSKAFNRVLVEARRNRPDPGFARDLQEEIARRRRERLDCEIRPRCQSLVGFVAEFWSVLEPGRVYMPNWHIAEICRHLEAVTAGRITRLLINIPPGSMKSLIVSVLWPAWEWGPANKPHLRYLTTSYEQGLVERDCVRMRRLVESEEYQALWGDRVTLMSDQNTKSKFQNKKLGGREGRAFTSLTGGRGDRVIIDDPHSVDSADSVVQREATERIFRESVSSRINGPDSAIVIVMQRLHEGDVSGIVLALDLGFEHLMLPMYFEPDRRCVTSLGVADPRTRAGEILHPALFPPARLLKDRLLMGEYATAGQWQQRPQPREGGMFRREWFDVVDAIPQSGQRVRAWDLAATIKSTTSNDPDYTVGLKGMKLGEQIIILDMVRRRGTAGEIGELVRQIALQDGRQCIIRMPQDPGQAGKAQIEHYVGLLAGYPLKVSTVTGDKGVRATPAAAQAEFGRIKLARGAWNDDFLAEISAFPRGRHDDVVDALADLVDELTSSGYTLDNV